MNIAMLTTWKVRCGIATYTENLVNALAQLGVNVYVVRVPRFGKKSPELLQLLAQKVPVDRVDLIHVQHEYGIWQTLEQSFYTALKLLKKPIVTTMHATGVRIGIDVGIAYLSDKVIVHNAFCRSKLVSRDNAVIIPHGASLHETPPAEEAKHTWGLQPKAPIVGYCGFISEYKGLETLIEAMLKVPKAGLLIAGGYHTAGDTPYIASLKTRTLEVLPNRCRWLGYIPDEQLASAYGAMDVVAYPSRFATESGALIMALSHGKAVLASAIKPFKEKEKTGALITCKDANALARKIKWLLKNPEERKKLESAARKYCEATAWPKIAKKHQALYKQLLSVK